jgi:hypothetical protein
MRFGRWSGGVHNPRGEGKERHSKPQGFVAGLKDDDSHQDRRRRI